MPLTLLLGPANCGKVAQLFDRFAEQAAPSRCAGFVDGLGRMFNDLAGSAPPELLERRLAAFAQPGRRLELAVLHGAFRARLAELGIRDRAGGHGRAAELLETRLEAWDDSPVFAYGVEDMSGVQPAALRALAARCPVMVSLPYEPGRPALE